MCSKTCQSFHWTSEQLQQARDLAVCHGIEISDRLWQVLKDVDRTLFFISSGVIIEPPMSHYEEDVHETKFHFEILALASLDLQPGLSLLVFDSYHGYVNQIAAQLLGPGGTNIGLCNSLVLERSKRINDAIFRLYPNRGPNMVFPFFTNNASEAFTYSVPVFDRILVADGSLNEHELEELCKRLAMNGKMVVNCSRSTCYVHLEVTKDSDGRISETVLSFPGPMSLSMDYIDLFSLETRQFTRNPKSLQTFALRKLAQINDPVTHLVSNYCHVPRIQGLYKWSNLSTWDLSPFEELVRCFTQFLNPTDAATLKERYPSSLICNEPLLETSEVGQQTLQRFDECCRHASRLILRRRTYPCNCAFQSENCIPDYLYRSVIQIKRNFICTVIKISDNSVDDIEYRQRLLTAIKRTPFQLGPPHHYEKLTTMQEMALGVARLVSDAEALRLIIISPPAKAVFGSGSKATALAAQICELGRSVEGKAICGHLTMNLDELGHRQFIDELRGLIKKADVSHRIELVLSLDILMRSIYFGLHTFVAAYGRSSQESIDVDLFSFELERFNSQIQCDFTSDGKILDFLAGRFLQDGYELSARISIELDEAFVAKLATQPEFYIRTVLKNLPLHTQSCIMENISLNDVFS